MVSRDVGVFHGKRGFGVSVESDVQPGPVTTFGAGQDRDGTLAFAASQGHVVAGPLLGIGNTTSSVDFRRNPGKWVDAWSDREWGTTGRCRWVTGRRLPRRRAPDRCPVPGGRQRAGGRRIL